MDAKNDYLFFFHSFLWAFAPWSILTYLALVSRLKNLFQRREEWLTPAVFIITAAVVSVSGFKLPHYLNIVFPATAVLAAAYIISKQENTKWIKNVFTLQLVIAALLFVLSILINVWAFPVKKLLLIPVVVLLLAVIFYFIKSRLYNRLQKTVTVSVAIMVFVFFLLNSSFYPQLLTFQGGTELPLITKGKINLANVYFWKNNYSSSFNFNTASLRKEFAESVLIPGKKIWLVYDIRNEEEIIKSGYLLSQRYTTPDYEITKLDIKFMNPVKRQNQCTKMVVAEINR